MDSQWNEEGLEPLPFQQSRFSQPEYVAFQFGFVLGLLRKFPALCSILT
jgi:hypothetical protein